MTPASLALRPRAHPPADDASTWLPAWLQAAGLPESAGISARLVEGAIAWIEIGDAAGGHALAPELALGLCARIFEVAAWPEARAIVLCGSEDGFLVGGAATELALIYEALLGCGLPVVAAMRGRAAGVGLCCGLFADVVVLAEEGSYSASFVDDGVIPNAAVTFVLKEQLGGPLGTEMLYLGGRYRGGELRARGLPLPIVPAAEVPAEALALARRLADKPRESLGLLKRELARRKLAGLPRLTEAELSMYWPTAGTASPVAPTWIASVPAAEPGAAGPIRLPPRSVVAEPLRAAPIARARVILPPRRGTAPIALAAADAPLARPAPITRQPIRLRDRRTVLAPSPAAPIARRPLTLPLK